MVEASGGAEEGERTFEGLDDFDVWGLRGRLAMSWGWGGERRRARGRVRGGGTVKPLFL